MSSGFDDLRSIVGRDEAEGILLPFREDLCEPCFYGVNQWKLMVEQEPERAVSITPRVAAGIIHCYVVRDAIRRLDERLHDGVRVRHENESVMLIFDELLVGRFKKVDAEFRASNSQTKRQFEYERQELWLPGLPDRSTNITFGYSLNELGTEVQKITALCWRMHRLEWAIPLYEADAGQASLFDPIQPIAPPAPERRRVIRPAVEPRKAEGQEG